MHMDETQTLQQNPLDALQALIERYIQQTDDLRNRLKTVSESMKSLLENDNELSEVEQQANDVSKKVKARKKTIAESPEFRSLRAKMGEMKDEMKEYEEALNTHLLNYFQQTGVKTVDLSSGAQREFRIVAKVLPKKQQKDE